MDHPSFVHGQIYLITNKETLKQYVGQSRSHYKSRGGYVKAGYMVRWRAHISEAHSLYRRESAKLNHSIRKYGENAFTVELLHTCPVNEMDKWEIYCIEQLETVQYGYNLTPGGKCGQPLQHKQISDKLVKLSDDARLTMLEGKVIRSVKLSRITSSGLDIASLTFRTDDNQYIKVDFGGMLRTFEESLARAVKFALFVTNEEKIIVQESLSKIVNLPKSQADDRLLQNSVAQQKQPDDRYESLKDFKIDSIHIVRRTSCGKDLATLVVKSGSTKKYVAFGGKLVNFEEAFTNAVMLALRLVDKRKITLQKGLKHNSI